MTPSIAALLLSVIAATAPPSSSRTVTATRSSTPTVTATWSSTPTPTGIRIGNRG